MEMILNFRFKKEKKGENDDDQFYLVVSKVVGEWTRAVVVLFTPPDCDIHHGPWFGVH